MTLTPPQTEWPDRGDDHHIRRNSPKRRRVKRNEPDVLLDPMDSPGADIASVAQLVGVTMEAGWFSEAALCTRTGSTCRTAFPAKAFTCSRSIHGITQSAEADRK
jgi:hypothetical protein